MTLRTAAFVWLVALLFFFVFSAPIADRLWMIYLVPHYGMVLVGVGIGLAVVLRTVRKKQVSLVPLAIVVLGLVLFFTVGFRGGRLALFLLRASHYEELQEKATRTGELARDEGVIEDGPPVRYAFYWQRGVLDNWVGVVYDPSGELLKAVEQKDGEMAVLFGGTLYRCEHMRGHWYLCWFT